MFLFPMGFMLVVTITSLILTIRTQALTLMGKVLDKTGAVVAADWGTYAKLILGALLVILAIILAVEGIQTLAKQRKAKAA